MARVELKRFYVKAAIATVLVAALSALIEYPKLPLGVIVGGLLGAINLREMRKSLGGMLGAEKPALRLFISSVFRLIALFAAIMLIAYLKVVNLIGLLAGFAVVTMVLVLEAARYVRERYSNESHEEGNPPAL